jgi:Na+/melibiose symporter-like transporter
MEPIIDPMFFYWIDVCGGVKLAAEATLILVVIGTIMSAVFYATPLDDDMQRWASRMFKWCLLAVVATTSVVIFTPTRQTLILMQVAKNITPDNVQSLKQLTGDVRESVKADIIDIMEAVTKEGDKSQ